MGKKTPKKQRPRYQLDLPDEMRERWERAAKSQGQVLASFIRGAVEEKIRKDGLG